MNSLFDDAARAQILARLESMSADSPRGWGKMTPAQALCHCAITLEVVTGRLPMRQKFIGKLLGPFFRKKMLGPEPFSRNSPTGPELVVSDRRDFVRERERVVALIGQFAASGPDSAARYEHGFIGRLTGDEWGRLMHKHLDHHLRQFGA
jgi:hypothetical protein